MGQEPLAGTPPSHPLNMPMIMLNVICELRTYDGNHTLYNEIADDCVAQIRRHVHEDRRAVFETVSPEGGLKGRGLPPSRA